MFSRALFTVLALAALSTAVLGRGGGVCSTTGDPHITTFDDLVIDNYGVGEYWMIYSSEFKVQSRLEKHSCSGQKCRDDVGFPSYNRAMVLQRKNGAVVEIDGGQHTNKKHPEIFINGKSQGKDFPPNDHKWHERSGVEFKRGGSYVILDFKDGYRVRSYHHVFGYRDLYVEIPRSLRSKVAGICGNYDGSDSAERELIGRSGKTYKVETHLHMGSGKRPFSPRFTRSWIVAPSESLFRPANGDEFKTYRAQLQEYRSQHGKDLVKEVKFANSHIEEMAKKICSKLENDVLQANCLVDSAVGALNVRDIEGIAKSEHHLLLAVIHAEKEKKQTRCGIPIGQVQELATLHQKKSLAVASLNTQIAAANKEIESKCAKQAHFVKVYDDQSNRINKELRLIEKIKGLATQFGDHHDEKQPLIKMLSDLEARLRKQLEAHLANKNAATNACSGAKSSLKQLQEKLTFEQAELSKASGLKTTFEKAMADCEKKEAAYKQCIADRDEIALLVEKNKKKADAIQKALDALEKNLRSEQKLLEQSQTAYELAVEKVSEKRSECNKIEHDDNNKRATIKKDLALLEKLKETSKGFSSDAHVSKIHAVLNQIKAQLAASLAKVGGEFSSCQESLSSYVTTSSQKKQQRNSQAGKVRTVEEEVSEEKQTLAAALQAVKTAEAARVNKADKCDKMPRGNK